MVNRAFFCSDGSNGTTLISFDIPLAGSFAGDRRCFLPLGKACWGKYDGITVGGVQMHFYRKPKRFGGVQKQPEKQDDKAEKRVDRFLCAA